MDRLLMLAASVYGAGPADHLFIGQAGDTTRGRAGRGGCSAQPLHITHDSDGATVLSEVCSVSGEFFVLHTITVLGSVETHHSCVLTIVDVA